MILRKSGYLVSVIPTEKRKTEISPCGRNDRGLDAGLCVEEGDMRQRLPFGSITEKHASREITWRNIFYYFTISYKLEDCKSRNTGD